MEFSHKDLLGMADLSVEDINLILNTAESLKEISSRDIKKGPHPKGKERCELFL